MNVDEPVILRKEYPAGEDIPFVKEVFVEGTGDDTPSIGDEVVGTYNM